MNDEEIVLQLQQLTGALAALAQTIDTLLGATGEGTSNASSDTQRALARGFSADSLDLGPLRQWQYVLACHLAARPVPSGDVPLDQQFRHYADYVCYLVDQILSDQRFVSEMNLSWSKRWREAGTGQWRAAREAAKRLREDLPLQARAERIFRALINSANTLQRDPRN